MGIKIEMPIRMAIFRLAELDKWRNGERENGKDFIAENCLYRCNLKL
ncbi:hypothetical protein RA955_09660 [Geobacillus proteiniphilus]|uniref:Mobile element protein n=1 Tax=Geobacillus proteiniphilus TaxID=860353 RepID=A0ABY9MAT4_9BACL|nr:hypothetical protein [Geobacillus proteiniphilus]WMJ15124.1 hypothetical protein RA955_09660 [Geobacillus proteiniphilus]